MPDTAHIVSVFQSTPPVKAATTELIDVLLLPGISIHAAREGGDYDSPVETAPAEDFNPRRP